MTENIDYLTQLKTRKYLFDKYNDFIENNNHAKAIMLDFRKLKDINDNFGHLVGDELLVAFSNLMKKYFDGDILVRMGGDEFLVLTSDPQKSIDQKLKAVRNGMMDIYDSKSINQSIPFNAGITPCLDDISRTLFQADLAMYSAKGEDKKIYSNENYKLLIKNNLFNKIDFSVLDSYLSSIKDSHDEYMINIYHDTLLYRDKDYVSYLKKHIDKFKIAHDRICINVNTAHYDGKAEILISRLNELKGLGVKVSIGNINLDSQQYILPIMALCNIDYIKVDRDILEGTMEENRVLKLVKSIVQMSRDLDIKTIFINVSEKEIKHVYKLDNNPLIRKIKDLD